MKDYKRRLIIAVAITIALSFSVFFVSVAVTFAAYTNSRHAQRTIATYEANGDRFSSNYLAKNKSKFNVKTIYTTSNEVNPSTHITICNYEQGKQALPYDKNVSYTITARLVYDDGSDVNDNLRDKYLPVDEAYLSANSLTGYKAYLKSGGTTKTLGSSTAGGSLSVDFSGSLAGNAAHSDVYSLTLDAAFAENKPNLYVEVVSVPSDASLPTIRAIFKGDIRSQGAVNAWSGEFNDNTATAPSGYDAYNYRITGVGSGTFILRWDGTKVKLNDNSKKRLLDITGATQDGNSITFPVDSGVENVYGLIFNKVNITTETWSNMNTSVVTFDFH